MNDNTSILREEFEAIKNELIAKHDELGIRASGNWANSLEVVISDNKAQIIGEHYSEQLEFGRKAGKQPPSKVIEQWIRDKGIAARIEGNISISSLAFLVARKIAREGWKRQQYGGVELITQVITPERIQKIIDKIGDEYAAGFIRDITTFLKQAA